MVAKIEKWDQKYSEHEFLYGKSENDFLRKVSAFFPEQAEILSLGEGEGRNSIYLAKQGFKVTALDSSKVALQKLSKWAGTESLKIECWQTNIEKADLGIEKWDVIVSIWFHLPSQLRKKVNEQVISALKPGGWIALEAYTPDQLAYKTGGPQDQDMLLTKDILTKEFFVFEFIILRETIRNVQEGTGHKGESATVQLLGRKPF